MNGAILGQDDLEHALAPLHMAMCGLLSAVLAVSLESGARLWKVLAVVLLSGLFSLGFSRVEAGWWFGLGWPVLLAMGLGAQGMGALRTRKCWVGAAAPTGEGLKE